jgi:transposase InsO family protein
MAKYISVNKDIDAVSLINTMIDRIFSVYGIPDGIVSNRGTVFTSQYWSDIYYQSKVKRRLSTVFHPQTDGQTERQN